MKKIAFFTIVIFQLILVSSCEQNYYIEEQFAEPNSAIPLERYDLWYVDYHSTQGADTLPFMRLAFTLSFENGIVYANNNISGIGFKEVVMAYRLVTTISSIRGEFRHDLDDGNVLKYVIYSQKLKCTIHKRIQAIF